ncbi:transcriptional regulator containing an amidase domain and an AraC-type DNA-binding HTH domain [Mycolicibacterium phlei]|jgi:transcriptional regulator GlxA family with amidase domain|uniref:AraC family transcriptional regulator n=1 Tax=Mycolicibacterium phlei DSM 43239 = CCUG 21000 TaxID=1226750 RepID=A0A5N5VAK4_MYCPH|nr:helix-turn-helix domain-containing protein [Mycolicibacterium phlei]VEG07431.1 transcriptional regulator containing an amidase domain and an AraC-type DNA-binding HTH domain [Mycobacteroides chelonae]AMO59299.1 HTH-type transcriptional regulator CdhR [Mycolicibacterium phlei]KAB7758972.1 AraC family transcriptional regulator [Mycolicibacterium phlei DSM 43239 = CCUG 21000]KXW67454.1 AraC family transcriptional regulator [Mycolicibacterium phlei DSM 43239 = CCUG 21000]KXW78058.1 AraC family 
MSLKTVSTLVLDGMAVFEFGVVCEVFGIDRSADGVPNFDFKVCGPRPGEPLRTSVGATLTPDHGLDDLAGADLVAIPANGMGPYPPEVLEAVRAAADAGSIILTVCSGAFLAGAAGLLDGRPCTTHWMHADELQRRFPTAKVDRNVLYVDDGNLVTSAGTAAGVDACLHLVRRELGSEVTNKIARRMVVPPHRDGGQRQYIDQPVPVRCSDRFAPHLDWILANLDKPHTVASLAARAHMSARTFARRFVEETGRTPMQWVTDQRVLYARTLLEETDLDIDRIAERSGFGTATLLRHHFRRIIGVTPSDYRRRFACGARPGFEQSGDETEMVSA